MSFLCCAMMLILGLFLLFARPIDMIRIPGTQTEAPKEKYSNFGQSVLGFTFNAGNENGYIEKVIAALRGPLSADDIDATLAFVCLQEAPRFSRVPNPPNLSDSLKNAEEEKNPLNLSGSMRNVEEKSFTRWHFLKEGAHHGQTKEVDNQQLLAIWFKPPEGFTIDYDMGNRSFESNTQCATLKDHYQEQVIVLCVRTDVVSNSKSGKGAAIAVVDVSFPREQSCFSLAVACAHLDSNTDEKRAEDAKNIHQHLERMKKGSDDAVCGSKAGNVILGDLNFRLHQSVLDAEKKAQFTTQDMLVAIAEHTQNERDDIFKAADPLLNGLPGTEDYTCNGIALQPPTYKVAETHHKFCKQLMSTTRGAETSNSSQSDLVGMCYLGDLYMNLKSSADKLQTAPWPIVKKGDMLQLGWLDRVCWKADAAFTV
eukprot:TRINITY_DN20534_c0_g1_i3.p1 TRINITY_DN20534_c0_g1~~TRINITY_DN20534_c0_g1_i3.p1  ORF type:complete len:426 (-),score=45.64 TRINITY_DN20534_c0_g1_i3:354-1631(-)